MTYPACLCGGTEYRVHTFTVSGSRVMVLICRRCGLGRTWPSPLARVGAAQLYEDMDDYEERFAELDLRRRFCLPPLSAIKRHVPIGARVTDVGCNLGVFVSEAVAAGYEATGIDVSSRAVAAGNERLGLNGRLSVGTLATANLPDSSRSVLTYLHSLEHIEDVDAELETARRVLDTSGILLIEVPRFMSLWRLVLGSKWYPLSPFQHIWQFSFHSLSGLLKRHGFEIIEKRTRLNMYHEITPDAKGAVKALLAAVASMTATADDLLVVARKRSL